MGFDSLLAKWILTRGKALAKAYKARKADKSCKIAALIESPIVGRENICWQKALSSSTICVYSEVFQSEIRGVDDVFE
jgi:hypothetical protein